VRRILLSTFILMAGGILVLARQPRPESAMASAAKALLSTLTADQAAKIRWPFDSEERFNWHFVPRERQGLSLKAMTEPQRKAAFDLLRAGLGAKGYSKAETIRSLENVLRAVEKSNRRDPELYFFTIFGEPGSASWGWRYEGHHIAQNWTIVDGKAVATTPAFLGANPAEVFEEVPGGPAKGTRALAAEEDLARALLDSLTDVQRRAAITSETAPQEIITGNSRKAAILENAGLEASSMTPHQRGLLMSLIEEHASVQPEEVARQRLEKVRRDGLAAIRFAWMGATKRGPGSGHYYRIQGTSFLIEYDNVQNNANHHHIVWRDFEGDFGADLLAEHHANDPDHQRLRERDR
jgi:uncharacterized protein DUF3500